MTAPSPGEAKPQRTAFRNPGFKNYWGARLASAFAVQILSVSVGWHVYDLTHSAFDLGLVGLSQFLPALMLVLVTGAAADRFSRRTIMGICLATEALCATALLAFLYTGLRQVWPIFLVLACFGAARAFYNPAQQSIVPNLVPPEDLNNAIAWNSSSWQIATILGPVVGGLLYGINAETSFITALVLLLASSVSALLIPKPQQKTVREKTTWTTLTSGFQYIWSEKIVLGAISLDLFAVLLGGATALLPVYARDILAVGPLGLGMLRAGSGIGAILVAAYLTKHPIRDHAGIIMFACVAGFGAFTILFGASNVTWVSVLALAVMGAFDMISVYIRETLIQLWTPDAVRGRVSAVNQVFVGASNELGEFRAGLSASAFGTVPAVVIGGIGTIVVAMLWAKLFPALREARHLRGRD
ncbi:Transmembrane secretion effector [Faunimonas pinastri]|uniref:Transmembrane secretion effector n=1 Tax=Faunimonas pinastri TaxID=1855383 RepID=A0A1H9LU24_9HYPH|nr:MFS transporter [Faunimonas pinastri]SER14961.1 Transmembrane secretion effector [Faunimonas pinastri]